MTKAIAAIGSFFTGGSREEPAAPVAPSASGEQEQKKKKKSRKAAFISQLALKRTGAGGLTETANIGKKQLI